MRQSAVANTFVLGGMGAMLYGCWLLSPALALVVGGLASSWIGVQLAAPNKAKQ